MESHPTCVFLSKYIHPVIFFNAFRSMILLLVIGRLHKTPGASLTVGKLTHKTEEPWSTADNQPCRQTL